MSYSCKHGVEPFINQNPPSDIEINVHRLWHCKDCLKWYSLLPRDSLCSKRSKATNRKTSVYPYPDQLLQEDIRRVEAYIAEHGQETGAISWQMARDSFNAIKQELDSLRGEKE